MQHVTAQHDGAAPEPAATTSQLSASPAAVPSAGYTLRRRTNTAGPLVQPDTDAAPVEGDAARRRSPVDAVARAIGSDGSARIVQRRAVALPTESTDAARVDAAPNDSNGLPNSLRHGVEALSGIAMDGVEVHYNSPEPATLDALAFTKGSDIFVGPGQEQHLPHEAWHVAQQAQGRVQPTRQLKADPQQGTSIPLNDEAALEREADVMGARAARAARDASDGSPGVRATAVHDLGTAEPPVQRRVVKFKLDEAIDSFVDPMADLRVAEEAGDQARAAPGEFDGSEPAEYAGPAAKTFQHGAPGAAEEDRIANEENLVVVGHGLTLPWRSKQAGLTATEMVAFVARFLPIDRAAYTGTIDLVGCMTAHRPAIVGKPFALKVCDALRAQGWTNARVRGYEDIVFANLSMQAGAVLSAAPFSVRTWVFGEGEKLKIGQWRQLQNALEVNDAETARALFNTMKKNGNISDPPKAVTYP